MALSFVNIRFFKQATNAGQYKESPLDVACKCPICGDSKNRNQKRLHLYTKGDLELVNCFNAGCPCENKTMYSFLRDFYPDLLQQYRKETFTNRIEHLKSEQSIGEMVTLINEKSCNDPKPQVEANNEPYCMNLEPFMDELTVEAKEYLKTRQLNPEVAYIANTDIKIGETVYPVKDFLIIPLLKDDLWYGFYSRSLKEKTFYTYVSTTGYKVWNWYNIKKDRPVIITEGIFDALSIGHDNVISNLGAKIPNERLKELKDPIFVLDNDSTGIKQSIKYAEMGYKVYIQPQEHTEKDMNELKLNKPWLDIQKLVKENTFAGISAIVRLKSKL